MTTSNTCHAPTADRCVFTKEEALALLLSQVSAITDTETLSTETAFNRVLATTLTSPVSVPGWDNSAMDGYAIRHADLAPCAGVLKVSQRIPAGVVGMPLEPGTAARIFTGAPVPAGADTVVVQEICERDDDQVRIPSDCKAGANIRHAGEDLRPGDRIIPAGQRLTAAHLGLAASVGVGQLEVFRKLRVAILTSGNELVQPGEPLAPGQIYNANRFILIGLLQGLGCEVVDLGRVADTLDASQAALRGGAREADLILASGGVSVGEEDHLKPALESIGSLELWNINIRPGKPVAFGWVDGTPVLGAPGNPVSLFVTCCLFARPLILRRQGICGSLASRMLRIRAGFDWLKPDKRTEYHRARLQVGSDGELELAVFPNRSSAAIASLTWADGLVEIAPGRVIHPGDRVDFMPFSDLLHA